MRDLRATVESVRARIHKHQGSKKLNEQNTKAILIEPVLQALGWNTEDLDEVSREFKSKRRDRPVDYALLVLRNPRLLLEAKALGENLDDRRWSNQIMGYAAVAGVEWTILTDGNEYRIYNSHAAVEVDEKLFRKFKVTEPDSDPVANLDLLSRDKMQENRIEALWRAHFVDRQVRGAIEQLFSPESDMALVNWLRGRTRDLTAPEIRASLARCQIELDFPLDFEEFQLTRTRPSETRRKKPGKKDSTQRTPTRNPATVVDLIQARLIRTPLDLFRNYKGKTLKARIERDGSVVVGKDTYDSLSMAAGAARATVIGLRDNGRLPATNGWSFWRFVDVAGKERDLASVREELPNQGQARGDVG